MKNISFFLFLFSSYLLIAQPINKQIQDIDRPSPNAGIINRFIDIPTLGASGIPSINIPITTMQYGTISVPVSLSYHAGGVKLAEHASWVGLNWNLNAGGMISRQVQGIPDEHFQGYYSNGADLPNDIINSHPNYCSVYSMAESGGIDLEPDIFSVSYPEGSYQFYINENKNIIKLSNDNNDKLRVITIDNDLFAGFEIITDNGTIYTFGKGVSTDPANHENTQLGTTGYTNRTGWYLTNIKSFDHIYSINFVYVSEQISYTTKASNSYTYNSWGTSSQSVPVSSYYTSSSRRLIEINSPESKIEFTANTTRLDVTGNRLDEITHYPIGNQGAFCKKFSFHYSHFIDNRYSPTLPYHRKLKLDKIEEKSCDLSILLPPTTFEYIGNKIGQDIFLPNILSNEVDHWGYYNGKTSNNSLIINVPNESVSLLSGPLSYGAANREIDGNFTPIGTLNKIVWPTGGNSEFIYESNVVSTNGTPTNTNVINITTCGTPSQACCGTLSNQANYLFTAAQLASAKFKLEGVRTYGTSCSNNNITITASVWNGTTQIGNNFQFNVTNGLSSGNVTDIPLAQFGILEPGINYTFRVQSQDGKGTFVVYTQSFPTTQKLAPGLRLKTITVNDGSAAIKIEKNYFYTKGDNTSSGSIRTMNPKYATGYNNVKYGETNGETGESVTWSDSPVNTNAAYGNTVMYSRIRESNQNNGHTIFEYDNSLNQPGINDLTIIHYTGAQCLVGTTTPIKINCITGNCIELPGLQHIRRGKLLKKEVYTNSNQLIYAEENTYNYINSNSAGANIKFRILNNGYGIQVDRLLYHLTQRRSQLISQKIFQDKVETITSFSYDVDNSNFHPVGKSFQNSNGTEYVESYEYTHKYSPDWNLKNIFVSKNIITRYRTYYTVQNIGLIDGTEQEYALFNNQPRLYKIYRDKYTWSASGVLSGGNKQLDVTINAYDNRGNIAQMTQNGWAPEYFVWNFNGSLYRRTFNNFVTQYNYFFNTTLLQSFTDIDGQVINYNYDKLQRLSSVSERNNNRTTSLSYYYRLTGGQGTQNFMEKTTNFTSTANSALTQLKDREYLDGLGRTIQNVKVGYSPTGKDVITAVRFDNFGRPYMQFEPYESPNTNGTFFDVPNTAPHTLTQYEASPLNRPASVTPPGWYASTISYGSNDASDAVKYATNLSTNYPYHSLIKEIITDPNANKTITFKDKLGRTILVRKTNANRTQVADTYTDYDDKGRVRRVFPPGSTLFTSNLFFSYLYDGEDKVVNKKVPDMDAVSIHYNSRDLPAAIWLPRENKWLVTNYDVYGRSVSSGLTSTSTTPSNFDNMTIGEIMSQTIYDGQTGLGVTRSPGNIDKGKITTERVKILGTSSFITSTNIYDSYGRLSVRRANNHLNLGSVSTISSPEVWRYNYDFADHITSETRTHIISGHNRTITTTNIINQKGLLQNIRFNGGAGESDKLIATMTYTHKNQLESKSVGNNNTLQTLNYTYNPQGWLTSINPNLPVPSSFVQYPVTSPAGVGNSATDLFQITLNYDMPVNDTGTSTFSQKNGNISQIHYQVLGREREYWNYEYDYLDRLLNASHTKMAGNGAMAIGQYSENITYDDHRGNIKTIKRYGAHSPTNFTTLQSGLIDDLTMTYLAGTNKLSSVNDNGQAEFKHLGFNIVSGANGGTANIYDNSGNITYDHSKKANITYNHLNLPSSVTFLNGGNKIDYQYTATGQKLRTIRSSNGINTEIQHYLNGIEYKQQTGTSNYRLEAIYTPVGRIYNTNITNLTTSTITLRQEFCIKDHLGNTRLTFTDKNNNGQVDLPGEILQENHYYPFGMSMGGPWMNDNGANDKPYQYNGKELESFGGLGWLDYGARFYDPSLGRFTTVDPLADHPNQVDKPPYAAMWNNPIKYNDPDGRCPICPFIAKGLTGAGIDYMLQGAMNFAGGMKLTDAFSMSNIDMSDVAISGAQGMIPWSAPGGKYGKAAAAAFSDVMINYGKSLVNGTDYSMEQMGQDFIIGFAAQLGSEKVSEFFGEGIVYLRKDASGNLKPYVGQAKSKKRFLERQKEHARANPDSDFEFDVLDRGNSKGKFPTDLDKKEQKHLDKMNGPTNKLNPNGGTSNKKNVIKKN